MRVGAADARAARVAAFAETRLELVLCPPGGAEEAWAAAFAEASAAPLERAGELAADASAPESEPESHELGARAWPVLERALARGLERVLAVLPHEVLCAAVGRALGLPPHGARALRVDPGRAVLLRAEPGGCVLRRSNALAPETHAGTALPGGSVAGGSASGA